MRHIGVPLAFGLTLALVAGCESGTPSGSKKMTEAPAASQAMEPCVGYVTDYAGAYAVRLAVGVNGGLVIPTEAIDPAAKNRVQAEASAAYEAARSRGAALLNGNVAVYTTYEYSTMRPDPMEVGEHEAAEWRSLLIAQYQESDPSVRGGAGSLANVPGDVPSFGPGVGQVRLEVSERGCKA